MSRSLGAGLIASAVSLSLGCGFFSLDEAPEGSAGKPATGGSNGAGASGGTGGSTGGTGGSSGGTGGSTGGAAGSGSGGVAGSGTGGTGGSAGASAGMGAAGTGTAGTGGDLAGSGPTGGTGSGGAAASGGMAGASMGGMGGTPLVGCASLNPAAKAHADHCYLLVTSAVSWDNAKNACMSLGGHLVTLSSGSPLTQSEFDAESKFVFEELGGKKETWVGMSDGRMPHENGDGAEFAWVNDEPLTLQNWNDNEPNHYQKNCMDGSSCYEHCTFIMADPAGKWNDELCEATKPYVCEWDTDGAQP